MKISVVIPAYNEESSIGATLEAISKQNYSNFEVIVVDNNSTDKTSEVVESFIQNHKKIKIKLFREERKGTNFARQKGFEEAKGQIVANLDADCLPDANWLQNGAHAFIAREISAAGGPYDYYDAAKTFRIFSLFFQKTMYVLMNYFLQKINRGAVIIGGNIFLRRDCLVAAGGYNTKKIFYGDDTDTAKRMAKQGWVVFDSKFTVKTSARRLKTQGAFKTAIIYIYHFWKTILK